MKVLHVLDHSLPLHSGYVFRTQGILAELRASGIETCHVTSGKHPATDQPLEAIGEYAYYRTPLPPRLVDRLPGVGQARVITSLRRRLQDVIESERPDVLHCHSPCLNAVAALGIARQKRIPVIYELRASWEDAAVSHGSTREGSLRYRASRALETYALRHADHVVTICDGLRRDSVQRGVPPAKVTVVPNAVDRVLLNLLDAGAGEPKQTGKVIGFFGSFYAYEGLDLLIDAVARLRSNHPEISLLLLGSGPQNEALRAKVSELGLEHHVQFLGRIPHEQVAEYYRQVDVFVFPRQAMRLTELVTPLKPLEAMAAGALVVASDVGGHRELIEHGRTGLLYAAGRLDALVDTLDTVLREPERYRTLRACGREFVLRERTWPAVAKRYLPLYQDLAG